MVSWAAEPRFVIVLILLAMATDAAARLLQTMTAIVGCGALITLDHDFQRLFLIVTPLSRRNSSSADQCVELLLLWSVVRERTYYGANALERGTGTSGLMVSIVAVFAFTVCRLASAADSHPS